MVLVLALPPLWVMAALVPNTGENGGSCLTYGENCVGWPGWLLEFGLWAVAVCWCVAVFTPDRGTRTDVIRLGALCAQVCAEGLAVFWVLSWA